MKRKDLKELIKECVREVVFEEGVLSELIAEVAFGITKAQTLMSENSSSVTVPSPTPNREIDHERLEEENRKKLLETKRKMLDAIGKDSMKGIFENTTPLDSVGIPNQQVAPGSPMSGISPTDSGVNIDSLLGSVGQAWKKLK